LIRSLCYVTKTERKDGINPEIDVLGILPTVVNMSRKESKITPDQLREHPEYGQHLLPTVITNTAAIGRLSERGFKDNKEILDEISPYLPIIEELMKHG
jgi:hypothetical protein